MAGKTVRMENEPSRTSIAKKAPPSGTLYAAAIPAPPPQATSRRRWSSGRLRHEAEMFATMLPACLRAFSRPTAAPIPTTMIEYRALLELSRIGRRPALDQTAPLKSVSPLTRSRLAPFTV